MISIDFEMFEMTKEDNKNVEIHNNNQSDD